MDFRDVPSRKLHDHGFSFIGFIRKYQHFDAACLRLGERVRQIRYLVPGHFSAIRIRKVSIGDQSGQLAKLRFDPDSPIIFCWPSDFDTRCARFIRDYTPLREGKKAAYKCIHSVR